MTRAEEIQANINKCNNVAYRYLVYVIGNVRGARNMVDVPEYFYTLEECDTLARAVTAARF